MGKKKFVLRKNIDLEQGIGYTKTYGKGTELPMPMYKKKKFIRRKPFYKKKRFFKRKFFKRKRFVQLARRLKGCTEEIKEVVYKASSFNKYLVYTNRTNTLFEIMRTLWNLCTSGTSEGQRIGNEIFVRYIVVNIYVNWTSTTYSDMPHRIMILKSKVPQATFNVGDILDSNSVNLNDFHYISPMMNAGVKKIWDRRVVCPAQYDLETAEPDPASEKTICIQKKIRIMKTLRELTTDPSYFNLPFMYLAVLRPPDSAQAGTGPIVYGDIRMFYQDA